MDLESGVGTGEDGAECEPKRRVGGFLTPELWEPSEAVSSLLPPEVSLDVVNVKKDIVFNSNLIFF